jgi:dTDP-4-dehydrorhamnose reductase
MMKVLVTGSDGMLGQDICAIFNERGFTVDEQTIFTMDITDYDQVMRTIGAVHPDAVIHTAAHTNVDECQEKPDLAFATNAVGTANIAQACQAIDAILAYVSSCGIFDGAKAAPYHEFDRPAPLTRYANSKYQGELAVRDFCRKYYIVRPGWLFGGASGQPKNFVAARQREAMKKDVIVSAGDKFGSPTYTRDFARKLAELLPSRRYGVYHLANAGVASRYDYVAGIIRALGLPNPVEPVSSDHFQRSAPVPDWEALDQMMLRLHGFEMLRPWQDALAEYVAQYFTAAE